MSLLKVPLWRGLGEAFPENRYGIGVFAIDGGAGETDKRSLGQSFAQIVGKAGY